MVIPTRDRWDLLMRRGLHVALAQTEVDHEVVVVDDGSASPPPGHDLLRDARVELIRVGRTGVGAARNAGIQAARSPWIAFLDDDDVWAPQRLSLMLAAVRDAGADYAYGSALVVDPRLRPMWIVPAAPPERLLQALLRYNAVVAGASNVVVRADLVRRLGGFDESFSVAADWDLWLRLAADGQAVSVPEPLLGYVRHERNWVLGDDPAVEGDVRRLERKHQALMQRHGSSVDWLNHDRYVAHSLLTSGRQAAAARRYARAAWRHRDPGTLGLAAAAALVPPIVRRARGRRRSPATPWWLHELQRRAA